MGQIMGSYRFNESRDYVVNDYESIVKSVTAKEIKDAAKKFIDLKHYLTTLGAALPTGGAAPFYYANCLIVLAIRPRQPLKQLHNQAFTQSLMHLLSVVVASSFIRSLFDRFPLFFRFTRGKMRETYRKTI